MTIVTANIFTVRCDPQIISLGAMLGMQALGCNLFTLPAGKRAFPFHSHHATEEMFIVLEGRGEFRLGSATREIGPGDIVSCPPGGPETAHQITNIGAAELRYIAISSKPPVDIIEYPDSGKFRATSMVSPGFDAICSLNSQLDYWNGE